MFDSIIRFSLANRALVLIAATGLLVWGLYTAFRLSVDVFPDLNAPTVTVLTEGHGMALHNVRERLRLLHDVAAHFETWRAEGRHHARVVIPL